MNRSFGTKGLSPIECINPDLKFNKWHIRWDIRPIIDEEGKETDEVSFMYKLIECHKPTINEIKDIVLSWMNSEIDKNILEGFEWNGMSVWLSTENQFNYKAAYDLAIQTEGKNLPIVFKFGTVDKPVYYKFDDVETLSDFYTKAMTYINVQLAIGWSKKDAIDWSVYENILNNVDSQD